MAQASGLSAGADAPEAVVKSTNDQDISLFYDIDDYLAPMEPEPPSYPMEVILDSGASDHVAAREGIPGYQVEESPGSRAGRHYTGASGHRIVNEGQANVQMMMPGEGGKSSNITSTLQIANVTRPLLSVSRICANGFSVLRKKDHAVILDAQDNVVGRFEQKNGLYTATMQARNPRCPTFHGQDR